MSTDTEPGIETGPGESGSPTGGPSRSRARTSWVVLVVLVVLMVAAGTFLAVWTWGHQSSDDGVTTADRTAAVNAAEQFTLRLDAIDYQDLTGYQKRLEATLTPKMKADFSKSFSAFTQAYQAVQITSKGEVKAAGVQDIDQDSATVLVIHDVNVTSKGCVQPPYKRMTVDLRKIHGRWLVDDFKEGVPGCQGSTSSGDQSTAPSASPSQGSSQGSGQ